MPLPEIASTHLGVVGQPCGPCHSDPFHQSHRATALLWLLAALLLAALLLLGAALCYWVLLGAAFFCWALLYAAGCCRDMRLQFARLLADISFLPTDAAQVGHAWTAQSMPSPVVL